ncbi:MAG: putative O-glycosylation ligase, exosortase A system-associated [Sphingobium sp.]
MRDLFFLVFLAAMFGLAFRRPFLFVLTYAYIDIVSPQRLSYYLLNSVPISAIAFGLAFLGWLAVDAKRDSRFSWRQILMILLLVWCGYTTTRADFPIDAAAKWDWVWKSLVFAIFLPLTLRTRLRIEALALVMILCASSIIVTGGIKTVLSGGGYGELNLMVDNNSGLYEGSTISMVAIAIIPLIFWLARHGTIFPPDWRVRTYAIALSFACLLIPIGTVTRTGLLCIVLLGALVLWRSEKRLIYGAGIALAALITIPFLPATFTDRMDTIRNYQGDESASTRLEVWKWTLDYVKTHPMGGGFDAYRGNSFTYDATRTEGGEADQRIIRETITDKARAYHSAYFEMLGEQGWPGLILWTLIHGISLVTTHRIYRRYRTHTDPDHGWISPLALALQQGHLIYLLGAAFVGIAYQPFVFMLLALQIGLATYLARRRREEMQEPIFAGTAAARSAG